LQLREQHRFVEQLSTLINYSTVEYLLKDEQGEPTIPLRPGAGAPLQGSEGNRVLLLNVGDPPYNIRQARYNSTEVEDPGYIATVMATINTIVTKLHGVGKRITPSNPLLLLVQTRAEKTFFMRGFFGNIPYDDEGMKGATTDEDAPFHTMYPDTTVFALPLEFQRYISIRIFKATQSLEANVVVWALSTWGKWDHQLGGVTQACSRARLYFFIVTRFMRQWRADLPTSLRTILSSIAHAGLTVDLKPMLGNTNERSHKGRNLREAFEPWILKRSIAPEHWRYLVDSLRKIHAVETSHNLIDVRMAGYSLPGWLIAEQSTTDTGNREPAPPEEYRDEHAQEASSDRVREAGSLVDCGPWLQYGFTSTAFSGRGAAQADWYLPGGTTGLGNGGGTRATPLQKDDRMPAPHCLAMTPDEELESTGDREDPWTGTMHIGDATRRIGSVLQNLPPAHRWGEIHISQVNAGWTALLKIEHDVKDVCALLERQAKDRRHLDQRSAYLSKQARQKMAEKQQWASSAFPVWDELRKKLETDIPSLPAAVGRLLHPTPEDEWDHHVIGIAIDQVRDTLQTTLGRKIDREQVKKWYLQSDTWARAATNADASEDRSERNTITVMWQDTGKDDASTSSALKSVKIQSIAVLLPLAHIIFLMKKNPRRQYSSQIENTEQRQQLPVGGKYPKAAFCLTGGCRTVVTAPELMDANEHRQITQLLRQLQQILHQVPKEGPVTEITALGTLKSKLETYAKNTLTAIEQATWQSGISFRKGVDATSMPGITISVFPPFEYGALMYKQMTEAKQLRLEDSGNLVSTASPFSIGILALLPPHENLFPTQLEGIEGAMGRLWMSSTRGPEIAAVTRAPRQWKHPVDTAIQRWPEEKRRMVLQVYLGAKKIVLANFRMAAARERQQKLSLAEAQLAWAGAEGMYLSEQDAACMICLLGLIYPQYIDASTLPTTMPMPSFPSGSREVRQRRT
jgi:hypothetical protein